MFKNIPKHAAMFNPFLWGDVMRAVASRSKNR
jgi:hypothetical protein